MKLDEKRFRGAIYMAKQTKIAKQLGISQPALSKKLKNLNRLRLSELYEICEALEEKAGSFFIFDKDELEKKAAWTGR